MLGRSAKPEDAVTENGGLPASLAALLLEHGLATQAQIAEAEKLQEEQGGFIGPILVNLRYVTQDAISACLVKNCKIPHINLLDYNIGGQVLALVPEELCLKHGVLPIDKLGRILTVAMIDPLNAEAITAIHQACPDLRIKPILCSWQHFSQVTDRLFKKSGGKPGAATVSMHTFGLTAAPPPKPVEVAPAPVPAAAPPVVPLVTAPAAMPAAATQEIVSAIKSGVETAMGEVMSALLQRLNTIEPGQATSDAAMADTLRDLRAETVQSMQTLIQSNQAAQAEQQARLSEIADALLKGAQAAAHPDKPGSEAVDGGLVSALLARLEAAGSDKEDRGPAVAEMLRDMRTETVQCLQTLIESNQAAQAEQHLRLSEIAEAVLQGVQAGALSAASGGKPRSLAQPVTSPVTAFPSGVEVSEPTVEQEQTDARVIESLLSGRPSEELTFDNYYPGAANEFAFKLSQQVAEAPGGEFNPLFLYGNVGVGKTHLITAIGNYIRVKKPGLRVGYISASHFAQRLADALQRRAADEFREAHCRWDALILDDIQFLGGRVEAQEEFFHVFNVLHQEGRQIIIAADKPPERLGLLEKRLISRFASGVVAELRAPEYSTRVRILEEHGKHSGVQVPGDVISLIATRVTGDVRRMTGALKKVVAFSKLVKSEINCEMALEILSHMKAEEAA